MIRTADAGGIVDEIGVDAPPGKRKFDPAKLRNPQIGPFTNDLGAYVAAIDPQCVVGAVTNVDIIFIACLDIGADTAEP